MTVRADGPCEEGHHPRVWANACAHCATYAALPPLIQILVCPVCVGRGTNPFDEGEKCLACGSSGVSERERELRANLNTAIATIAHASREHLQIVATVRGIQALAATPDNVEDSWDVLGKVEDSLAALLDDLDPPEPADPSQKP